MSVLLYPPYLQWEVVADCNHKCVHCYNYWRTDNTLTENCTLFEEITNKILERKPLYVAITGGEPLIVFDIIKNQLSKMVDSGITVSISTNGTLLTEEIISFLKEKNIDLVVSLPSINPDICDKVCSSKNVVKTLMNKFELLKKYKINTVINIVINKLNILTIFETLKTVKNFGFIARIGLAQKPINASRDYYKYDLSKSDFDYIVNEYMRARQELDIPIDFSVCIPDCAFNKDVKFDLLEKGSCFAGALAYAITTTGMVKACQCDTKEYGNILTDDFETIYKAMSEWRDNSLIPNECYECSHVSICRGGCKVETFATKGKYKSLPSFANIDNIPLEMHNTVKIINFNKNTEFELNKSVIFLKDKECYRLSVGIIPTLLPIEFAEWLYKNKNFSLDRLAKETNSDNNSLITILNLLVKNKILTYK